VKLRIVVERPPKGVDYGLQKGRGSAYEVVQKQRSKGKDLIFEFEPAMKEGVWDPIAAMGGPFVQGPPGGRFVYLDIGQFAGQADCPWNRRMKIPLEGITVNMAAAGTLETRVPGTGPDGTPACATVKYFDGWKPLSG
jgi:hypothetical protein